MRLFHRQLAWLALIGASVLLALGAAWAQRDVAPSSPPGRPAAIVQPATTVDDLRTPAPHVQAKVDALIADVIEPEIRLELDPHRSKLVRTKVPITQLSVTDPQVVEVVQFSPTEFELIGGRTGETTLTLWFGQEALRYLIRVSRDEAVEERTAIEYGQLERRINELFPNSMVQLIPIADKLIVRGQARDAQEAAAIMAVIGGQAVDQTGRQLGPGSFVNVGPAARPSLSATDLPAGNVISLLEVTGEQQVMLKVRVAELSRSALREMGVEFEGRAGEFTFSSLFGIEGAFSAILDTADVTLAISALSSSSYSKILAEPNLVTLNGQAASFLAGGEFAVPTVVGIDGVGAATTSFRGFGVQLEFTPTIIDRDRIRLIVNPSISSLNQDNSVDGIPGLDSRTVSTTVDLREGQWLAIAGLLQDQQSGGSARIPVVGDIPYVGTLFGKRNVKRDETELVVLVSPELIRPLEAEEVPLILPGMEVTEPNDCDFFLYGRYEGRPECHYRSTVAPLRRHLMFDAKWNAHFGPGGCAAYVESEQYYVQGDHGFSR